MPVSHLPALAFTLTLPSTTVIVQVDDPAFGTGAAAVPDNCRTIVVLNMAAGNRIFVRFGMLTEVTAGNTTINNSTVVPALGSFSFDVGYIGDRLALGDIPTNTANMYLIAETGNNVPVNITYMMGRGTNTP